MKKVTLILLSLIISTSSFFVISCNNGSYFNNNWVDDKKPEPNISDIDTQYSNINEECKVKFQIFNQYYRTVTAKSTNLNSYVTLNTIKESKTESLFEIILKGSEVGQDTITIEVENFVSKSFIINFYDDTSRSIISIDKPDNDYIINTQKQTWYYNISVIRPISNFELKVEDLDKGIYFKSVALNKLNTNDNEKINYQLKIDPIKETFKSSANLLLTYKTAENLKLNFIINGDEKKDISLINNNLSAILQKNITKSDYESETLNISILLREINEKYTGIKLKEEDVLFEEIIKNKSSKLTVKSTSSNFKGTQTFYYNYKISFDYLNFVSEEKFSSLINFDLVDNSSSVENTTIEELIEITNNKNKNYKLNALDLDVISRNNQDTPVELVLKAKDTCENYYGVLNLFYYFRKNINTIITKTNLGVIKGTKDLPDLNTLKRSIWSLNPNFINYWNSSFELEKTTTTQATFTCNESFNFFYGSITFTYEYIKITSLKDIITKTDLDVISGNDDLPTLEELLLIINKNNNTNLTVKDVYINKNYPFNIVQATISANESSDKYVDSLEISYIYSKDG
ncbi:hypothetical protein [Spiroplasma turonicum]|uniref:Lipoprotein n=1 Tax=Spiroplasma turonicum TaxID=216946 RepID=A0A0K1P712_9MOLU|nr:hypothetical protein [Spiroplasma turonicum]AKU80093.1 hypothetical protein STURON_00847 [Spiroplasma turonicum]ALX71094.1 hypothetical protein STURO_v1c08430 [Spiroplasma turonicum]